MWESLYHHYHSDGEEVVVLYPTTIQSITSVMMITTNMSYRRIYIRQRPIAWKRDNNNNNNNPNNSTSIPETKPKITNNNNTRNSSSNSRMYRTPRIVSLSIVLLLSCIINCLGATSSSTPIMNAIDTRTTQQQQQQQQNVVDVNLIVRRELDSVDDTKTLLSSLSSSDGTTMKVLTKKSEQEQQQDQSATGKTKYDQIQDIIARSKEIMKDQSNNNNNNGNKQSLKAIVHVGPMKTGSSGIQEALRNLRNELTLDNYEFGNSVFKGQLHKMHMCFDTKFLTSNNHNNTNPCDPTVLQQIHNVAVERNHNLVISAEAFHRMDMNLELLKEYFISAGWTKIIIVMFYRRYYEWLLSYYNQGNKYRPIKDRFTIVTYVGYQRHFEKRRNRSISGKWGDQYTISEYLRYQKYFNNTNNNDSEIHLYHMHNIHDGDVRESLICTTMGESTESCKALRKVQQQQEQKDGTIRKVNSHRPLIYEELAYYALHMGLWVQHDNFTLHNVTLMVQHYHEVINNKTEYDFTIGINCLDDTTYEWLLNATLQAEEILFPEYYNKQGRDEILLEFEHNKREFCDIDAKIILQAPNHTSTTTTTTTSVNNSSASDNDADAVPAETLEWRKFFSTLQ